MTRAMVAPGVRERFNREAYLAQGEKSLLVYTRCPYRKPTQVDEERILRPAEEVLLRNSAK